MPEHRKAKRLISAPLIGEQGAALAKLLVLEMGSTWHATDPLLETGIDAWIELRDPATGVMTNRWVAVQVKAHQGRFKDEDDESFTLACESRHLAYWADGNAPVILIVTRPYRREAWWIQITREMGRARSADVLLRFDKHADRLGPDSFDGLAALVAEERGPDELPPSAIARPTVDGFDLSFASLPGSAKRPLLTVRLRGPARELTVVALLDSGADFSCFPYGLANELGIDLSACENRETATAAGSSAMHVWPDGLTATVLGMDEAGPEVQLMGVFGPTPMPLLGRQDFFAAFQVTFDQSAQRVTLRPSG